MLIECLGLSTALISLTLASMCSPLLPGWQIESLPQILEVLQFYTSVPENVSPPLRAVVICNLILVNIR